MEREAEINASGVEHCRRPSVANQGRRETKGIHNRQLVARFLANGSSRDR